MQDKRKLLIWGTSLGIPAIALLTIVIAGYIYALYVKTPFDQVGFFYYLETYGKVRPGTKAFLTWQISGVGAGFLSLAVLGGILYLVFVGPEKKIYGDARFASSSELRSAGFFKPTNTSIVIGKLGKNYLYYSGQQFALLSAPTRSGKGVGIVIPNLLTYKESMVVLDIKQENFDLTSGFRASHGQEIFLFNPFAEDGRTHRWNPLSYVSSDLKFRISDLMSIAVMLYPVSPDGKDQFYRNQAQNMFVALTMYMLERRDYQRELGCPEEFLADINFGEMYRLSSSDGAPIRDHLQSLSSSSFTSPETRTSFGGFLSQNEEVLPSIIGTFKEPLLPWLNPIVDKATSANDFSLTDVRKKKMTIYIVIQPNKLAEAKLIINLFFSQLINENTKELPQSNPELKYQCLLLMDEFTSIGRVDIITKSVAYMAGYNLRLFPIIQSLAQLDGVYGKEDSRTLVTNHALQILYTPRIQSDATEYSEMLGYRSAKKGGRTLGRELSRNESEEKRALMLPQELKSMSGDKEIIIYESINSPIFADKIKYYKDSHLTSRLVEKIMIPQLPM